MKIGVTSETRFHVMSLLATVQLFSKRLFSLGFGGTFSRAGAFK